MKNVKDVVDGMYIEFQEIDSIFKNKQRSRVNKLVKQGVKELNMTFPQGIKGMNVKIPMSCRVFKPEDYEYFIQAYLISCDGRKIEIKRNNNVPSEVNHFILDCDGSVVRDCVGDLTEECIVCNPSSTGECIPSCTTCCGTGRYMSYENQLFLSEIEKYKDVWIKEEKDYFSFSSELEGLAIVIEYASNNISNITECEIPIRPEFLSALEYYVKWKLLEDGIETSGRSKEYYIKYKTLKEKALSEQNSLTLTDIYATFMRL